MKTSDNFNLDLAIKNWEINNLKENEVTSADRQEFINHFYDSVEELIENGLSKEEAYFVVERRFGTKNDWAEEMRSVNEDNFHLKQIVTLFSGIVLYLVFYNLIVCFTRLILIVLVNRQFEIENCLDYTNRFFIFIYALMVATIVASYFLHKPIKWIIHNISMRIKNILFLLGLFIFSLIAENYLTPLLEREVKEIAYRSLYYQQELLFKYIYSILVGVGYVIIYIKYHKKNLIY